MKKIGAQGGKASTTGGFAAGAEGKERASYYGRIGGKISRRGPKKVKEEWHIIDVQTAKDDLQEN